MVLALAFAVIGIFIAVPAVAQQQQPYWYYCDSAKGYYPYVQTCPEPWSKVAPNPQATTQPVTPPAVSKSEPLNSATPPEPSTNPFQETPQQAQEDYQECTSELPAPLPGEEGMLPNGEVYGIALNRCLRNRREQREEAAKAAAIEAPRAARRDVNPFELVRLVISGPYSSVAVCKDVQTAELVLHQEIRSLTYGMADAATQGASSREHPAPADAQSVASAMGCVLVPQGTLAVVTVVGRPPYEMTVPLPDGRAYVGVTVFYSVVSCQDFPAAVKQLPKDWAGGLTCGNKE